METEQFDELIRSLEIRAGANRRGFVWRTGALALLGYVFLLVVLIGSLAITASLLVLMFMAPNGLTIKLGLVFGIITGGIALSLLKALWVRMDAPEGLPLTRENAPEILALVEKLRSQLRSAPFHHILLTSQYNASVCQIPRLGMFGWHRNYLLLGLPLLQSMQPREFEAVLAHEFAHLASGHGRFGNWLYRLRRSWEQLIDDMRSGRSSGGHVLIGFLKWFWPRFNAHAFVLSRVQEYEADAVAAEYAGAENIARSLMRISVYDRHLDESFWDRVSSRATHEPKPPQDIFTELPALLRAGPPDESAGKWMRQAFLINTNNSDTHPCLRERLAALGQLPPEDHRAALPVLDGPTAAEAFLGEHLVLLQDMLSRDWAEKARLSWMERHETTRKLAEEVSEAEAEINRAGEAGAELTALYKKASALIKLEGGKAGQPLIAQILERDPGHTDALYMRGEYLLSEDEEAGIADVRRAMELDPDWTKAGLDVLASYHHRHGNKAALRELEKEWEKHSEMLDEAEKERSIANASNIYEPHGLDAEVVARIAAILAAEKEVQAAWSAQKKLWHLTKHPLHVLGLRIKFPFWQLRRSSAKRKLIDRLIAQLPFPEQFIVFIREKDLRELGNKIAKVEDSLIYQRPPPQ